MDILPGEKKSVKQTFHMSWGNWGQVSTHRLALFPPFIPCYVLVANDVVTLEVRNDNLIYNFWKYETIPSTAMQTLS